MAYEVHAESVELDGTTYRLTNGRIQIEDLQPWKDPIRTIGNQRRSDRSNLSQLVAEDFRFGIGFPQTKGAVPIEGEVGDPSYRGLWDSEAETRYPGQVTLPGLLKTSTHHDDADEEDHQFYRFSRLPAPAGTASKLTCFSSVSAESIAKFNNSSLWETAIDLHGEANSIINTSFMHKGEMYYMGGTIAAPWAKFAKCAQDGTFSTITPTTNVGEPVMSATSFGDIVVAACIDSSTGAVEIWKSSNFGDSSTVFTQITGMNTSTLAVMPLLELVKYRDSAGARALYLTTTDGLYLLDFVNEELKEQILFPWRQRYSGTLERVTTPTPQPCVVNGLMYIPRGQALIEYHYSGAYRDISPLTQARTDTSKWSSIAEISCICPAGNELFVGVSYGTTWSVHSYDGNGFHFITKQTNSALSYLNDIMVEASANDNNVKLHMVYHETSATNQSDFRRVEHVLREPLANENKEYATAGYITLPLMDGGMGEVDTNIVQIGGNFEQLTANETVIITTDLDSAGSFGNSITYNNTITGGGQLLASGAGVSAKKWQHKVTFARGGTATSTPVFLNLVTYFEKLFPDLNRYTFDIDVSGSLQYNQGKLRKGAAQSLLEKLLTSRKKITLLPFEWGGEDLGGGKSPRYVRIENFPRIEEREGQTTKGASISTTKAFVRIVAADRV